jgi:transcriptional regulator with XRE-family HTH domain
MVRLKAERLRRGLTQQELGFHAHVTASDISRFERGWARPYPGQARRLSEALELSETDLLDEVEDPHPPPHLPR